MASQKPSLTNIDLILETGQILGLAGPSGSGKSTLLRLIAGLEEPDSGQIWLEGQPIATPSQKLVPGHEQICLLNQDSQLRPNLDIVQNIQYALRHYNPEYRQYRTQELIGLCKLDGLEYKFAPELSGGQRQKAAWAAAIATNPKILLLDEPFSHTDPLLSRQLQNILLEIIQNIPCIIILASHQSTDLLPIAHKIMMLYDGQNIQTDTPQNIYYKPKTPKIAEWASEISLLTPHQLGLVGLNDLSELYTYGVRSSDIKILQSKSKQNKNCCVIKSEFYGEFWLLQLLLPDKNTVLRAKSMVDYKAGTLLNLKISAERLLAWPINMEISA